VIEVLIKCYYIINLCELLIIYSGIGVMMLLLHLILPDSSSPNSSSSEAVSSHSSSCSLGLSSSTLSSTSSGSSSFSIFLAVPTHLLRALRHQDKRIRYVAAETIIKLNPKRNFGDASRVIAVLKEALGEWDARVILVIDDDDASRNKLVNIIREMNMVAFGANSGFDGLQRAKTFPPEDMIIVSSNLDDMPAAYLVNALRDDYRTQKIPILITAPHEKIEILDQQYKNAKIEQVKGFLSKPYLEATSRSTIKEHLVEVEVDYKSKTRNIARRAAEALASIPINSRSFASRMGEAQNALSETVESRHDSVRGPAIIALGKFGDSKAVDALREEFFDSANDIEIRRKVIWALGQIFNRTNVQIPSEDVDKILKILEEKIVSDNSKPELLEKIAVFHQEIFKLFGQANISPADRRKIFRAYRINGSLGTAKKIEKEELPEEVEESVEEDKPKEQEDEWEETASEEDEFGDDESEEDEFGDDESEDDEFGDDESEEDEFGDDESEDDEFEDDESEDDETWNESEDDFGDDGE